jgi:predicted  nucleic acid-binding Zn-ribbon protein
VAEARAAQVRAGTSDPALTAEIRRRLDDALRQREEADSRLESLTLEIEDLNERKESIRQELQAAQDRMQAGGTAG